VTFANTVDTSGKTTIVTGTSFAEYEFSVPGDIVHISKTFTISVPSGAPIYLSSLRFSHVVGAEIKATGISVDPVEVSDLGIGSSQALTITVAPTNTTYPDITYVSADTAIATVNSTGTVTAIAEGDTTVTATLASAHSDSGVDLTVDVPIATIDTVKLLQISTNDGSQYGGTAKAADVSGVNYASTASIYSQRQVEDASENPCLTAKGVQKLLVIPVEVSGYEANATDAIRNRIYKNFFGDPSDTSWESVSSFYWKSSYEQLLLQGTVSEWWDCGYSTSQISGFSDSDWSSSYDPTWRLVNEAVAWYKDRYHTDCSEFDQDGDGYIDAVWLVYSAPDYSSETTLDSTFWAYTYSVYFNSPSLTSPMGWKYCWASYDFMSEGYGYGNIDAHTYIHETGHLMGLDDYYTYSGASNSGPMGKIDMMDNNIIDHNAYSKFAYNWIDPIVVSGACEITLQPSATTGQAVLIPTSGGWNGSAFDEYLLAEFYTPTNLNEKDSEAAYPGNSIRGFTEDGVRLYHVDARLCSASYSNGWGTWDYSDSIQFEAPQQVGSNVTATYTIMAHSNSTSRNQMTTGTQIDYRLIQEMDATKKRNFATSSSDITADNTTLFQDGDSFSFADYASSFPEYYFNESSVMDDGSALNYKLDFSNMSDGGITIDVSVVS
jgi:M6 family metalloprotease-like protein